MTKKTAGEAAPMPPAEAQTLGMAYQAMALRGYGEAVGSGQKRELKLPKGLLKKLKPTSISSPR